MKKGIRSIVFLMLAAFFSLFGKAQQNPHIDSLEKALSGAQSDKEKIQALGLLCKEYRLVPDAQKAMRCARLQMALAQESSGKKEMMAALMNLGMCFGLQGTINNDSMVYFYANAQKLASALGDKKNEAQCYRSMAIGLAHGGDIKSAIAAQFKALNISESISDHYSVASVLNDLGNNYLVNLNFVAARKFFFRSAEEYGDIGKVKEQGVVLNNIGCCYMNQNLLDSATIFFKKALAIAEQQADKYIESLCLINLGIILEKQNEVDHKKVLDYYLRSLALNRELKGYQLKHAYMCIGSYYVRINDLENGERYLDTLLQLSLKENDKKYQSDTYVRLAELALKRKDYKNAYQYIKTYAELKDTLISDANLKQSGEMEAKYQAERKQREITLLQKENLIKKLNMGRDRARIIALSIALLVVLVGAFFLFQWYKLKQKQLLNNEMLRQQELRLSSIVEAQEEERKRIAKDLHDGVGQLLSSLKLNLQSVLKDVGSKPEALAKLTNSSAILDDTATEVRNLSHQMMPRVLNELGLVSALEDMLNKSFRNSGIKYEFEHSGISGRLPVNIEIGLYRIGQELINNIVKHSGATEVSLQLFRNSDQLIMMVEDNGKGFNVDAKNGGHGLLNVETRARLVNGNVNYDKGPEKGMVTTIRIPVVND